jgi:zinc/manganese transport system substrate-binding protein
MRMILRTGPRIIARILAGATAIALAGGGLGACGGATVVSTSDGRVRVVVAENFWGSLAAQIGGPDADVTSIITNPATDPHDYEPSAADARSIATAQYVIVNGIGYDAWAQHLLAADPAPGRTVLNVGDLLGLHAGDNPHQWYSPAAVHRFIARVTSDLERIDPRHRDAYERREHALGSSGLRTYHQLVAQIRHEFAGTPIGASESIMAPLATALGLHMMTPASLLDAIAEGNEPTEADKATADAQIETHKVEVFVYNTQNATPDVQRLVDEARRAHIPVTTVTETLAPAGVSFQTWQTRELRALLAALQRRGRA